MTTKEQMDIFSKNLRKYVSESGKEQKEIAKDLGYNYTTFNTWMRGTSMPNAAKIQTLADYFGIMKSDLLDENQSNYYFDEHTAQMADALYHDENMRLLFDAARDSKPEDLKMAADFLKRLKGTNPDG